jgi:PAS domain S-box-containing protein
MARILVVEDEIIVAWDIKENLEKSGHTVVNLALSGAEAIQSATTDVPDLVLMDIHLEGDIDGIEASDDIYHRLKIPVVYLTAHADEFTVARATQTNPFGYIVKPFQLQSLQTTIKIALQRHNIELAAQTAQISLGNTLENIGSGIIINDQHGIVTFINAVAQELTGWSSAAAVGMRVDRVFCLIRETDSNSIENPSLQAMRLNEAVKSPDRSWLVAKDRSETPVVNTATPICKPNGEVIGGIIVFQDNTDRLTTEVELYERNKDLEDFQLKLISQLSAKTVEYQQSIACIELWDCLLTTVWMAPSETAFLSSAIQELGKIVKADYGWIAIHDRQESTARIICEYIDTEHHVYPASKIAKEIDIQLYPQFYDRLLEIESWIDPPIEIIPTVYRDLLSPTSRLAICPIIVDPSRAIDRASYQKNWIVGEIGIVTTSHLDWESFQSQAIVQIFSHAIQLFRKTHPQ